jgi:hypothetical protein
MKLDNVAAVAEKPAVRPGETSEAMLPTYQRETTRSKIRNWMADNYWKGIDRELGLEDSDKSLVRRRQEARLAQRIVVAEIAAGVEKPPVWTRNRKALAVAQKAISKS